LPSLKEFVEALQAGWFPALVAVLGCSLVLAGNWYDAPYLANMPSWLTTTVVIVGLFATSILLANLLYAPVALFNAARRWRVRKAWRSKIGKLVDEAPEGERAILAYLVTTGRRAFAAKLDNRALVPLLAKGIIQRVGGHHSVLEWPHIVQDDVWSYLSENKDRFVFEKANEIPDPFHWLNRN
jgi:Super-infection exclusion protein B